MPADPRPGSGTVRWPERAVAPAKGPTELYVSKRTSRRPDGAGPVLTAEREEGTGGPAGGTR